MLSAKSSNTCCPPHRPTHKTHSNTIYKARIHPYKFTTNNAEHVRTQCLNTSLDLCCVASHTNTNTHARTASASTVDSIKNCRNVLMYPQSPKNCATSACSSLCCCSLPRRGAATFGDMFAYDFAASLHNGALLFRATMNVAHLLPPFCCCCCLLSTA